MEWINIHTSTLDSEVMLDVAPEDGWAWLCLLRYCIGQENAGRIVGASHWEDRKCLRTLRVSRAVIDRQCALWWWEDADLCIEFYPADKQAEVEAKRRGASLGGLIRQAKLKAQLNAKAEPKAETKAELDLKAEAQRKGREGNGKELEKEGKHAPTHTFIPPSLEQVQAHGAMKGVLPDCCEKFYHEGAKDGWNYYFEKPNRSWQSGLMSYFVSWRAQEHKKTAGPSTGLPKNAGPADKSGQSAAQKRFHLSRELEEIEERMESYRNNNMTPEQADRNRAAAIRLELKNMEGDKP